MDIKYIQSLTRCIIFLRMFSPVQIKIYLRYKPSDREEDMIVKDDYKLPIFLRKYNIFEWKLRQEIPCQEEEPENGCLCYSFCMSSKPFTFSFLEAASVQ
jgi:hypothetical protein